MTLRADRPDLSARLRNAELSLGTFLGLSSTIPIEIAGLAGCEWAVLDLEHGSATMELVGPSVQAARAAGISLIARASSPERSTVGWLLDQGVDGVMIPRVESIEHAREVVSFFSYPPKGQRGAASYTRAAGWGSQSVLSLPRPACIIQIETPGALQDVSQIAHLEGVDALFIGPLDLSFALDIPEDFSNKDFTDAFSAIIKAGSIAEKPVGSLASNLTRATEMKGLGVHFLALASDSLILRQSLKEMVDQVGRS